MKAQFPLDFLNALVTALAQIAAAYPNNALIQSIVSAIISAVQSIITSIRK